MNKLITDSVDPIDPIDDKDDLNDEINESLDIDDTIEDVIEELIDIEDDTIIEEESKLDSDLSEITDDNDLISKHKISGKHGLKYDSIFKGKKEDPLSDEEFDTMSSYYNENFEVDKGSIYWFESIDNENYIKEKRIKEKVYEVLLNNTDLNFLNNRRKPSKSDFNNYYFLVKTNLKEENFTNTELFNELAVYFSDNLFNMFKLLDNKWRSLIILELEEHIGKYNTSPEVSIRNIHIGTEVEFKWIDDVSSDIKIITGVVVDIDDSLFIVDSYEKIYHLQIDQISKILNNNKFKYNLNKLNNIDFL